MYFGFWRLFDKGGKKEKIKNSQREREFCFFSHLSDSKNTHTHTHTLLLLLLSATHDEDQLDEEADKAHDDEAERGLGGDLGELCFVFRLKKEEVGVVVEGGG